MTTTFEIVSAVETYQAFGIGRVVDPYSVYNSLSRVPAVHVAAATPTQVTRVDTADFSGTSTLVAAALGDEELQTERIAALRQSIADKTYRVPAEDIAESILKSRLNGW